MRLVLPSLVAVLCVNAGCITAARKIEQAIRRSAAEPQDNRPAKNPVSPDELPHTAAADFDVRPVHPRLMLEGDWPAAPDATAAGWQTTMRKRADTLANQPPIEYSAKKLLTRSREALKRISLYGAVYRFTKDTRYADAGRRELLNVCGFADWQPDDFLATAEMMNAVALGYDWLYDTLSPSDRKTIVDAIVAKGLRPALTAYSSKGGWTRAQHNWNLVCNGGVIVASLAVMQEQPAVAKRLLGLSMDSIRYGLSAYDKAGGTAEGPMYHSYGTRYLTFAAASLKTAPTKPVTLSSDTNWLRAGDFRLAMTGPTGKSANFGDGSEVLGNTAWMFWLAQQKANRSYAAFETNVDASEPSPFDLLWYRPTDASTPKFLPGPKAFGSAIVLRPPGDDPAGPFVAVRTGGTNDHHSHLDLGNFVFDVLGKRFVHDLGPDNYDLPGYMTNRRADYLRTSTPGHNTLTIGDTSQPNDADARSDTSTDNEGRQVARVDMADAYPGLKTLDRTFTLDNNTLIVRDEIKSRRFTNIVWHLHTPAKVTLNGNTALLDVDGKQVEMKIISPESAKLTSEADATDPPQLPVENSTHLYFKAKVEEKANIEVRFRPVSP